MDIDIIISLIFFAFCAGAIDAAVGGGGLIQIPALMNAFPSMAPATLFGTNKLAAVVGTATSAVSFARKVRFEWKLLAVVAVCATISSFWGAASVAMIPKEVLQPFVLLMLIVMAVYTLMKKQFGQVHMAQTVTPKILLLAGLGSLAIGFYDGLFGPGTGSFLVFLMVRWLGFDFINASGSAKVINVATNLAALLLFTAKGYVWWHLTFIMAGANILGSLLGSYAALRFGTGFVRYVFIIVVATMTCKVGFDAYFR